MDHHFDKEFHICSNEVPRVTNGHVLRGHSFIYWSECINIWHVTSFGHSFFRNIWQNPGERYRHIGPLVLGCNKTRQIQHQEVTWAGCSVKVNSILSFFRLFIRLESLPEHRLLSKVHKWSKSIRRSWENRILILAMTVNVLVNSNAGSSNKQKMCVIKRESFNADRRIGHLSHIMIMVT